MSQGLDGVVVAETRISGIDGEQGRLWIRGWDVEDLARRTGFEGALALLWEGELPDAKAEARWRARLGRARVRAARALERCRTALETDDAMEALRATTASLVASPTDELGTRIDLVGALPVFAAAWARHREGLPDLAPDPEATHAEDFLRLLQGQRPDPARAHALDRYWVTVAEHGMNASTFTARVVASTQADPVSVVVAALGALKGPLHGGAPGPVLDMLDAIGHGDPEPWIRAELAAGRRIMGMGHRVYRVRDPRAAVLEALIAELDRAGIQSDQLAQGRRVERVATRLLNEKYPERPMAANVEFATAVLLDTIGLPRAMFTSAFAIARVAGWLAHDAEQRSEGRILRPRQHYVGARPTAGALAQGA